MAQSSWVAAPKIILVFFAYGSRLASPPPPFPPVPTPYGPFGLPSLTVPILVRFSLRFGLFPTATPQILVFFAYGSQPPKILVFFAYGSQFGYGNLPKF